jgi:GTP-binding protein
VGKSSLFNRIVGRRAAVVADREGVTRDRHYQEAEWQGHRFRIVDTGGLLAKDRDSLNARVREQIESALDEAALILFVVDGKVGLTTEDQEFARLVLRKQRPILLVVNKSEKAETALESHGAWALGMGKPHAVSALSGFGMRDLLDELVSRMPDSPPPQTFGSELRLAVLGRPNAGKSTLVNAMLGEERVITSETAGTTRDAIDTEFEYQGRRIVLTDTAGLRKKARVQDEVEYFSNMRALEAVNRSQVCLLLVDAVVGIGEQDFRICQKIQEAGRGLILILSKWDAVEADEKAFGAMVREIKRRSPELEAVPFIAVSAKTGKRVAKILDKALEVKQNLERVLGRENVIRFCEETLAAHPHPSTTQGPVAITRCCQVLVNPVALTTSIDAGGKPADSSSRRK